MPAAVGMPAPMPVMAMAPPAPPPLTIDGNTVQKYAETVDLIRRLEGEQVIGGLEGGGEM